MGAPRPSKSRGAVFLPALIPNDVTYPPPRDYLAGRWALPGRSCEAEISVSSVSSTCALNIGGAEDNNGGSCVENSLALFASDVSGRILSFLLLVPPRSISRTIGPMTCILVKYDVAAGYRACPLCVLSERIVREAIRRGRMVAAGWRTGGRDRGCRALIDVLLNEATLSTHPPPPRPCV